MTNMYKKADLERLRPGEYCFYCLQLNPRKIIGVNQIVYECLSCGKRDGLLLKLTPELKMAWHNDELQHFTIGALLFNEKTEKFVLMMKRTYPLVIDVIAGHVHVNENPEQTLQREVEEETGLTLTNHKLLWEGMVENKHCRYGAPHHYWYLFFSTFSGIMRPQVQEVNFFKEYTWPELMTEQILNPSIFSVLHSLNPTEFAKK